MNGSVSRRGTLAAVASALLGGSASASIWVPQPRGDGLLAYGDEPESPVDFEAIVPEPVIIKSVEQWRTRDNGVILTRVRAEDGTEGVVRASSKADELVHFVKLFAVPAFVGTDARRVHRSIERAFRDKYEYAGLPYWAAIGQTECAILDLLGKVAKRRVADMLGPVLRETIPFYVSSNRRNTSPEQEVAHLQEAIATTGAKALKVKIGRRMGRNTDFIEGRSEQVIKGVRAAFGDDMVIYADANGAYDAVEGIRMADMLADYGVNIFEEPCPFEDFEATRQVADGSRIKIAGGEQDYAFEKWRWYLANSVFDVVQPDMMYGGGMLRCLKVMQMAHSANVGFAPHFPRNGADIAPLLHIAAVAPNLYGYQEYRSRPVALDYMHSPEISLKNGVICLPQGAGYGIEIDPRTWNFADRL